MSMPQIQETTGSTALDGAMIVWFALTVVSLGFLVIVMIVVSRFVPVPFN